LAFEEGYTSLSVSLVLCKKDGEARGDIGKATRPSSLPDSRTNDLPSFPPVQFPIHSYPSPTASIPIADNAIPKPSSSPLHPHLLQVAPEQEVTVAAVVEPVVVAAAEVEIDSMTAGRRSVMKLLDLVGIYSLGLAIAVVADREYSVEGGRKVDNSLKGALWIPEPDRVVVKNMFWIE
jgi:hypothetical protein